MFLVQALQRVRLRHDLREGVQKNVGPAGMVVCIIREDLIRDDPEGTFHLPASTAPMQAGSMYNYPPELLAIYCCGKVFKYLKSIGGLKRCTSATSTRQRSSMTS